MSDRVSMVGRLLLVLCALVFLGVLGRVAQLQLEPDERLSGNVGLRQSVRFENPVRGEIFDRRGRVIASTRFAKRVFVDPTRFRDETGEGVVRLARAIGVDPSEVGQRIVSRMAANEAAKAEAEQTGEKPRLIQYVSIGEPIEADAVEAVRELGLPGVYFEDVPVREYPAMDQLANLLGLVGVEHTGLLGFEYAFDEKLTGERGEGAYVRDASRRPLWIEPGTWKPARAGDDVRMSLDLELQRIAVEELQRGIMEADAAGGRLVMADPRTGEILAIVDLVREIPGLLEIPLIPEDEKRQPGYQLPVGRYDTIPDDDNLGVHPALAKNRCVEHLYEPGSSFKPFIWATVTEAGKATPDEVFNTERGVWRTSYGRRIEDVTRRDEMTWHEVLVNSSNIGMIKATERLSFKEVRDKVLELGFGRPTRIGLSTESAGAVTSAKNWSKYTHTSIAFGHEVGVTPVQILRAFGAFAREGEYAGTIVDLRLTGVAEEEPIVARRVFGEDVSHLVREALVEVAAKAEANLERTKGEGGWRYTMFGKSGTADVPVGPAPKGFKYPVSRIGYYEGQYNSSFIAGAPFENPRLTLIVVIDDPGPELIKKKNHYGSWVAAPVARRVLERSLEYLGVEPDIVPESEDDPALAQVGE